MQRARRSHPRLVRLIGLSVFFALILSYFTVMSAHTGINSLALARDQDGSQNGKARKVEPAPPVAGPPAANLPNLDQVRQRLQQATRAPIPIVFNDALAAQGA